MKTRRSWIGSDESIPITRQCELTGASRSTFYHKPSVIMLDPDEKVLLDLIDEEFTRHPFYGSRRMSHYIRQQGYQVNRKRVQRLMRVLSLAGMAPGPKTSEPHPEHRVYPYLLRGVNVTHPNQVWSADISVPQ
ncbi:conserved hypothetical protein [Prosthecochloris aestuarii DSM 271]|uniref:HTH-like domain-containing protein n=1 Tax=Prosthecochloris aestuarii (strain DSM 271 / SK 413) TaxID=290512 RepID=B4S343_PROA2|nr:transposase [Prosthecochloris aestuarii]ACF45137.1 conserved hypothetical protein [Prosthecochloris aestuarii DSM 271]